MNHFSFTASTRSQRTGLYQLMQIMAERFALRSRIVEFHSAAAILFVLGFAIAERV